MSYLADSWIVDSAGIYTHYDHCGLCDEIEIPCAHVGLKRTGNRWHGIVTTTASDTGPAGQLTFEFASDDPT